MNGRVIFCTVLTAILAALYGSFPEECSFLAGKLGRAILSFADSDWVDESRVDYANGETALMYFSSTRNLEKVRSELEQGAIIDAQDLDGNTALMRAALSGHEAVVHLLLSKGADPNVQTKHGGTALMHASFRGHTDVVTLLLKHNADARILDEFGGTALMRAADKGHSGVIKAISEHSPGDHHRKFVDVRHKFDGFTAIMRAALNGHVECVKEILKMKPDLLVLREALELESSNGKNVLTLAREANQKEVVALLMEAGAVENFMEYSKSNVYEYHGVNLQADLVDSADKVIRNPRTTTDYKEGDKDKEEDPTLQVVIPGSTQPDEPEL